MEKILKEMDCFIYAVDLTGRPPSESDLAAKKALDETIAAEREAGKIAVQINDPYCEVIIRGALKIGLTQNDLNVFLKKFKGLDYRDLGRSPHYDKEKDQLNTATLLDEIFEIASSFENSTLGDYFIQCAYDEVQSRNNDWWASHILVFNKHFKARLAESNTNTSLDLRPLAPYFHGSKELDLALKAAAETGLLNNGKWVHIGEKTNAVSIFWIAAVTARLAKADAPVSKVRGAMNEQFIMELGINAINKKKKIADFEDTYKELYKSLLAIMRP